MTYKPKDGHFTLIGAGILFKTDRKSSKTKYCHEQTWHITVQLHSCKISGL